MILDEFRFAVRRRSRPAIIRARNLVLARLQLLAVGLLSDAFTRGARRWER